MLTVKRNQPSLHSQLRAPALADDPGDGSHPRQRPRPHRVPHRRTHRGDRRDRVSHARLAIQITRRRRSLTSRKWHTETVYAITDMTYKQIRTDQIADAIRGHWGIENRLHWIRDVVFAEDHSQIRTGAGPAVMATLRKLIVSLHRLTGAANIAAACRHVSRHPNRVLPLLG